MDAVSNLCYLIMQSEQVYHRDSLANAVYNLSQGEDKVFDFGFDQVGMEGPEDPRFEAFLDSLVRLGYVNMEIARRDGNGTSAKIYTLTEDGYQLGVRAQMFMPAAHRQRVDTVAEFLRTKPTAVAVLKLFNPEWHDVALKAMDGFYDGDPELDELDDMDEV
ncbi:hypothetical protein KY328_05140 [Candidatus Woesearchaeota archaeon]|nr:hypothetical protein [Candidatus Woesearchaeota archaeon]MBW3022284.1 hypothetical protein [Candidatus Woesearchaeota archaeon]